MRRRSRCDLCAGQRRRLPVGYCQECTDAYCERHGTWQNDRWLCNRCARQEETAWQPPT